MLRFRSLIVKARGYFSDRIMRKFRDAFAAAVRAVKAGDPAALVVSISSANSKMGAVASVSLLPFLTCPGLCAVTCGIKCYAAKLANLRRVVLEAYARNTALAFFRPDMFWNAVDVAMKGVRFFRFHVSGDIPTRAYFARMLQACRDNPHCEVLVFTKRYEIVNEYLATGAALPENLHLLFSGWTDLDPVNPYELPETNVYATEDEIRDDWKLCGGNCFECGCRGLGCWQARRGDVVAFKLH